ncbi:MULTISPECIES: hypothetical protein [Enterococcus]|uniref:Uncharacterized protein n=1 Tax=Enterococcus faecium SD2A-2 TaxID=1244154 RepID=A0AB73ADD9_ENTFC|nr:MULTISPECIES: hypothetical protein [Enterococcus]EFF62261.1 hypothetical protein CUO_2597 [Enterococcus faecium PC4.1]EPI16505.1 hypothetical protein D356_00085 [Enterococcus faecium SD2A-2]MCK6018178.1 hypothetical protein [Enterococcus faecium]MCK6056133.1 hypothetical protein [Enterococcus faecium]MCZ9357971.1 hypothetical protein [Enterococcus faecium]
MSKLLSLIAGPNRQFAVNQTLPLKQWLFGIIGTKLDKKAKKFVVEKQLYSNPQLKEK